MKSISGSIEGCYSGSRSVDIDDNAAPTVPTLVSPANGAFINDNTPLFDWNDVTDGSGINRYTLELATTSGFGATIILTQNIDGSPASSQFQYAGTSSY